ncbi:hypothetical protein DO72_4440 [Burkholderia pseudomallei]|nr:hypothetical protein DO72_4440 [Burkholderia pseudomallei]
MTPKYSAMYDGVTTLPSTSPRSTSPKNISTPSLLSDKPSSVSGTFTRRSMSSASHSSNRPAPAFA